MLRMLCLYCCFVTTFSAEALSKNDDGLVTISLSKETTENLPNQQIATAVDPRLPNWIPTQNPISDRIISMGSDHLNNIITLLAEIHIEKHPHIQIDLLGKGSASAMSSLTSGRSSFGPTSRLPKEIEIDFFYEMNPDNYLVILPVAFDILGIFVHQDNPIDKLSLEEIRGVFSSSDGTLPRYRNWSELGGNHLTIKAFGRNSSSFTYGHFRWRTLLRKDFAQTVIELPGSRSIMKQISENPGGIGYTGIGYQIPKNKTKLVKIRDAETGTPHTASLLSILRGDYPIARPLYLALNADSAGKLPPSTIEFLRLIYSKEGQQAVVRDGYTPIPEVIAAQCRKLVNLMDSNSN